jgi:hypothetical protein
MTTVDGVGRRQQESGCAPIWAALGGKVLSLLRWAPTEGARSDSREFHDPVAARHPGEFESLAPAGLRRLSSHHRYLGDPRAEV